jgi:hypothetical protein
MAGARGIPPPPPVGTDWGSPCRAGMGQRAAEQQRIVAKVDELMALCDRLEANLTDTAATRGRLLDALLAEALSPAESREVEAMA